MRVSGERVRLSSHTPQWIGGIAVAREKLLSKLGESGLAAPAVSELVAQCGLSESESLRALDALVEAEDLILLEKGVYIHPEVFARGRERVKEFLTKNGRMNIAQARELLGASRKYLLPFLEMLDKQGVTRREGDFRVLVR
jgi:selenocysteine-specific elongation factor